LLPEYTTGERAKLCIKGKPVDNSVNGFDDFWKAYPRKIGKGAARRAYEKALGLTDAETIWYGARAYKTAVESDDPRYVKHPSTWLNAECWDDEYEVKEPWGKVTYSGEKLRQREEKVVNLR
jgi:hypothetical protein